MKTIFKLQLVIALTCLIFNACKKDETKLYYNGGTSPVLSSIASKDTVSYADSVTTVLTLNWTNPDYQFTTGESSLDVTYTIEIDTVGSNFTNPALKQISVSKDLSYAFTGASLNDIMLNQLNLDTGMQHHLQMRVLSNLTNSSAALVSNSFNYSTTPYVIPPKVVPPFTGNLYLVGSATAGGWENPVPVPSQEFTKTDALHYTITLTLSGGQEYLFLPDNGSWNNKYACAVEANQAATGGDFGYNLSSNFPGPTASGSYKIDVDFQKGKYTVTKQ